MTGHNLLLYASLEGSQPDIGPAAFAVNAAAALGAHLTILAPHIGGPRPGNWESQTADQIEQDDKERHSKLTGLVASIVAKAHARAVSTSSQTDWAHAFGPIPFVGDQAKLHDLVVIGTDQSIFLSERKFAEHVLIEAGRPVVFVPPGHDGSFSCKRVTVAWDHTRAAARALHDALPFLRLAEEVTLTVIGGEKQFQTNPDRTTIEDALSRKGLKARLKQVALGDRTIGQALQQEALANEADLLVMGAYGHSRLREFILGGATREVLDTPRLPVLMSH